LRYSWHHFEAPEEEISGMIITHSGYLLKQFDVILQRTTVVLHRTHNIHDILSWMNTILKPVVHASPESEK
jgi:hypothetical protein